MELEKSVKEILLVLPGQLKSHYFSRAKKEKAVGQVLESINEQLKPVIHSLWNEMEKKEQEVRTFIYGELKKGETKDGIQKMIFQKGDSDWGSLFQLTWEEVNKKVEEEKFFVFKEIGERITDQEIWNQIHQRCIPDEKVLCSVGGSLKSEYFILSTRQVFVVKKGISTLLKGSFQMAVQAIPVDQILDMSFSSNLMGASMNIRFLSGSCDFKFKKEYQAEMDEIAKKIREKKQKAESDSARTEATVRAGFTAQTSVQSSVPLEAVSTPVENEIVQEKPVIEETYCPNCNTKINPNSKFCGNCGQGVLSKPT